MKQSVLSQIICPTQNGEKQCHDPLALAENFSPSFAPGDTQDIHEGLLRCTQCSAEYPILLGLAVLTPDVLTYLRTNYGLILALAADNGLTISRPMLEYLHRLGAHVAPREAQSGWNYSAAHTLSLYLCAHYDNVLDALDNSHPLGELLQKYYGQDLYSRLVELLSPHLNSTQRALDIGCNVGRMSRELAARCNTVYSIDLAFGAAFTARRALLGLPAPLTSYELFHDGLMRQERRLDLPPYTNAEVLIASGTALPFPDAAFDVVNSSNIIDVVPDPAQLTNEKIRVLKEKGIFAMTDPYCWEIAAPVEKWLGGRERLASVDAVRQQLAQALEILAEADYAPWVLRDHDRKFSIYLNHCLVGCKRQSQQEKTNGT